MEHIEYIENNRAKDINIIVATSTNYGIGYDNNMCWNIPEELKNFNEEGFIFYTNYNSEKGKAILNNPNVCLSFFWPAVERQIIIKGVGEKTKDVISDTYFASRPNGSKLGAIVSSQSEVIPNRAFLENNLKELEKEWEGKEIIRPANWGGFLVRPVEVEFWQGRPNRLHDRIRYQLTGSYNWKIDRLSP